MGLSEYERKRRFNKTPEPPAKAEPAKSETRGGFFCVQRHDATHLHYDFRLEVGGVLVSWAVPKGPSLDPGRKPLAMKVEDHPLAYGTFEGNIPKGEYGGGSVMLWDQGRYEVIGDPAAEGQLERGDFKFELHGQKLKGSFAIVRMKNRGKGNEWLLIKKKDEFADPEYDIDQFAWSVATHRTQEQIAENANFAIDLHLEKVHGAKRVKSAPAPEPMLATPVSAPPQAAYWTFEIKWDGVRALCRIQNGLLEIFSRRGNRVDAQYPELRDLPAHVRSGDVLLDGEICVLDEQGRGRFELIQPRIHASPAAVPRLAETTPATLFLFDVLYADGYDLRGATLEHRREILQQLLDPNEQIRLSQTFDSGGSEIFEAARAMQLEGILAKDRRSHYEPGRSSRWQKIKVLQQQEFVIGGFTKGAREYFAALVLGVYENGELRHVGQVGTGFDTKQMKAIYEQLQPLASRKSPFAKAPKIKAVTWLKPELVCQVSFLEWTEGGNLRAPVFIGLRTDKDAASIEREQPEQLAEDTAAEAEPETAGEIEDAESVEEPSALVLQGKQASVEVDGHKLKFTNLEKVYFPKENWRKRDLLAFYDGVSPFILPHLHDRPLSLKRYPNGIHSDFFFQKNASEHFPDWMKCEPITEGHPAKTNHYPVAQDRASLLYLVNLGCIDHNPWMSSIGSLEHPDYMLIDLDPVETSFDHLVDAALLVREILTELELKGYCKTTGGDGIHVYVPLDPVYTFEQVRSFAEVISHLAVDREPNLFTTPRSVDKRKKGRVYFDYLQIGTGKTIAAPYVVRAYDGAPVATPLDWKEVKHGLKPEQFRMDNALERFRKVGDLFAPVLAGGQRIEIALENLKARSA